MGVVTLDLTDGGGLPGEGKAQLVGKVTRLFSFATVEEIR
jgi:hypothetical protein